MKDRNQTDTDIAQQRYRGPSPVVAGLGESFVHGKFLLLTGALVGTIAGAVFPTRVGKIMNEARAYVTKLHGSENHLIHGIGGFGKWSIDIGENLVGWIRGIKPVESGLSRLQKNDPAQRVANAINSAIITSAGLSILGLFTGFFTGSRTSTRGKHQFENAKSEILTTREENAQLRQKLIETQFELEDVKTAEAAKRGKLKVASDDTPQMEKPDPIATPASHVHLQDLTHERVQSLTSDVALN